MNRANRNFATLCSGYSMSPTLRPGDQIMVAPYGEKTPSIGDIILFRPEKRNKLVVHRIYRKDGCAIITRGDNNLKIDQWRISSDDIICYVASASRGKKRIIVNNGFSGRIEARYRLLAKSAGFRLSRILHPAYRYLSDSRIVPKAFSHRLQPQIYEFTRPDGPKQLHLYLNGKPVGRRRPNGAWHIRRPYRLFIDVTALP